MTILDNKNVKLVVKMYHWLYKTRYLRKKQINTLKSVDFKF